MHVDYLRTFCVTVELGSMAAAAARLGMSQPAVSHEIRALEDHLGVRLLDRTPEGVVPTEYGRIAFDEYRNVVDACDRIHARMAELRVRGSHTVAVAATAFPGGYLVPQALAAFRLRHPDVTVDLRVRSVSEATAALLADQVDTVVVDGRVDHPDFVYAVLGHEPAVVCAGTESPWVGAMTVAEWMATPHVVVAETCTAFSVFTFLTAARLSTGDFRIACVVDSWEAAKTLVAGGTGLGIFPARAVRAEIRAELLRVVTIENWQLRIPILAVRRRPDPLGPMVQDLVELVRGSLKLGVKPGLPVHAS